MTDNNGGDRRTLTPKTSRGSWVNLAMLVVMLFGGSLTVLGYFIAIQNDIIILKYQMQEVLAWQQKVTAQMKLPRD
jgi:hypothetical protein